jgi:hypothetical protein
VVSRQSTKDDDAKKLLCTTNLHYNKSNQLTSYTFHLIALTATTEESLEDDTCRYYWWQYKSALDVLVYLYCSSENMKI